MGETLAEAVRALRDLTRLSQREFATAAKIGKNTLANIESGKPGATPSTLRLIADAAVREAAGSIQRPTFDGAYIRLMLAAGHMDTRVDQVLIPVDDLTDDDVRADLERRSGNPELAVSLLSLANNWRDLDPKSQRLVLDVVRHADGDDDDPPSRRRR